MKKILIFVLLFPLISFAQEENAGKKLFKDNCKACHSIDQNLVGPALKDVHLRRDSTWLYAFVKSSQTVIASGDSLANALFMDYNQVIMPDQLLSNEEIGYIFDYIKAESLPKDASLNPIQRPETPQVVISEFPMRFSNFKFWIPYTIAVVLMIAVLFYLTVVADIGKKIQNPE